MRLRTLPSLLRVGSALALVLVALAGCTKGGQFDPTEMFNSDVFDSKKKLTGEREPLFPNGVPGTTTGVPADLVKGYQPPPDSTDTGQQTATAAAPPPAQKPKPKPIIKPAPKPKLAAAPAKPQQQQQDSVWNQVPASSGATRINIGAKPAPAAPAQATSQPSSQAPWPGSPQAAPAQQAAQPSQSIWPNPPAPGTSSQ